MGSSDDFALKNFRERVRLVEDWKVEGPAQWDPALVRENLAMRRKPWRDGLGHLGGEHALYKAYFACMLAELAYAFIPEKEIASTGRLKVIPCERFNRSLKTGDYISEAVWKSLDGPEETRIEVIEGRLFHKLIFQFPEVYFLVFRGTKAMYLSDWKINLCTSLKQLEDQNYSYYCHSGFLREATECLEQVFPSVRRALERKIPIYATGHSLGGALAGLLYRLYGPYSPELGLPFYNDFYLTSAYTFCSPRYLGGWPGDFLGRHEIRSLFPPFHFRTPHDPVPFLPPKAMGYADPEMEFDDRGIFLERESPWAGPRSIMTWRPLRLHSITRMRRALATEIGADPELDILPRKSPEREAALRAIL
jgi:hypothetical protein